MRFHVQRVEICIALILASCIFSVDARAVEDTAEVTVDSGPQFRLYSESVYQEKTQAVSQLSRLHVRAISFFDAIELYGGVTRAQSLFDANAHPYSEEYTALYPGLRFSWREVPLGVSLEYWRLFSTVPSDDVRLTGWGYQEWLFGGKGQASFFSESYGETVFSSRISNEVSLSAWSKIGRRVPLLRRLRADGFLEVAFKRDRLMFREENLQEVRPGVRLTAQLGPLGLSLSGTYAFGRYAGGTHQSYRELKSLFVISGEI